MKPEKLPMVMLRGMRRGKGRERRSVEGGGLLGGARVGGEEAIVVGESMLLHY